MLWITHFSKSLNNTVQGRWDCHYPPPPRDISLQVTMDVLFPALLSNSTLFTWSIFLYVEIDSVNFDFEISCLWSPFLLSLFVASQSDFQHQLPSKCGFFFFEGPKPYLLPISGASFHCVSCGVRDEVQKVLLLPQRLRLGEFSPCPLTASLRDRTQRWGLGPTLLNCWMWVASHGKRHILFFLGSPAPSTEYLLTHIFCGMNGFFLPPSTTRKSMSLVIKSGEV